MPSSFNNNVFLNCPLDKEYLPLLKPLIFTIFRLGLSPVISTQRSDSGEIRLNKIIEFIQTSRFCIHDLSRFKSAQENEYSRMNMPFEIGVDFGCRNSNKKFQTKRTLILEAERYSCQRALSDLSGIDPKCHNSDPQELVYQVRTWFSEQGISGLPAASVIWDDYNIFQADLYETKSRYGFNKREIDNLPINEFITSIQEWMEGRDD